MSTIRLLLVDDHPVVRAGIRGLLNSAKDIEIIGEAENGQDVLPLVQELTPDMVLLDMELPGLTGIEIAKRIQSEKLPVKVLALSAHDDEQYIQGLLSYGVFGYITKEEAPEMIIDAVRGVARGEKCWISRKVLSQMVSFSRKKDNGGFMGLTRREAEVLKVMATGKTNQEIGLSLGISEKTVERHLQGAFTKMGVVSRVEAAVRVVKAGFI